MGGTPWKPAAASAPVSATNPTFTPEFYYYPEGKRRFQHTLFGGNYYKNDFIVTPQPVETYPWTG